MKIILLSRHPENFPVCHSNKPYVPSSYNTTQTTLKEKEPKKDFLILSELDYQMLKALNVDGTPAIFILDYNSYLEDTIDLLKSLLKFKEDAQVVSH